MVVSVGGKLGWTGEGWAWESANEVKKSIFHFTVCLISLALVLLSRSLPILSSTVQFLLFLFAVFSSSTFGAFSRHFYLSKATYNKYICQKKEKKHIAVGTLRMFI